jgi:hypothetical protein
MHHQHASARCGHCGVGSHPTEACPNYVTRLGIIGECSLCEHEHLSGVRCGAPEHLAGGPTVACDCDGRVPE